MGKTDDEVARRVRVDQRDGQGGREARPDASSTSSGTCFAKFQLSKTKSQRLYQALHDAVVNVHDPSYGDKAIDKLKAPGRPDSVDSQKDQLDVVAAHQRPGHQRAAVHEGGQAAHRRAAHADEDVDARRDDPVRAPEDGEGRRAGAHQGAQRAATPTTRRRQRRSEDKANIGIVADVLAQLGRARGARRDPRRAARRRHRHGAHRARAGARADARATRASSRRSSRRTTSSRGTSVDTLLGALKPRSRARAASANFYDPKLTRLAPQGDEEARRTTQAKLLQLEAGDQADDAGHRRATSAARWRS